VAAVSASEPLLNKITAISSGDKIESAASDQATAVWTYEETTTVKEASVAGEKADTATVRKVEATDERSYKQGFTTAEWAFMAAAWLITFVILYIIQKRIWTKQY
jgi:DNA-directed RNA polymerase beta subunit